MRSSKKILIIGFGSVGARHYRNLVSLGYNDIVVYDIDAKKITPGVTRLSSLTQARVSQFDIAIICSPNNRHMYHATLAARAGCHLFIEKPLSHTMAGIVALRRIVQSKRLIALVACNMRFHPCLNFLKQYLDAGRLGRVYRMRFDFGYYLPKWRVETDYRKNYAARRSTGGGIILDDIHEFDLLFWFNKFSQIIDSKFVYAHASKLEIETEDVCEAVFQFSNGVIGSVACDYLQQSYTRRCEVVGEQGTLEWDFKKNTVLLRYAEREKKIFSARSFEVNDMYLGEMKYFMACVAKRRTTFNDLSMAAKTLDVCLKRGSAN